MGIVLTLGPGVAYSGCATTTEPLAAPQAVDTEGVDAADARQAAALVQHTGTAQAADECGAGCY